MPLLVIRSSKETELNCCRDVGRSIVLALTRCGNSAKAVLPTADGTPSQRAPGTSRFPLEQQLPVVPKLRAPPRKLRFSTILPSRASAHYTPPITRPMPSRSPSASRSRSRGRSRTRSQSPAQSRSPRRSVTPRSASRSRSRSRTPSRTPTPRSDRYSRRNGRGRSYSRSGSRSPTPDRGPRRFNRRSYSRSVSRGSRDKSPPRSSKVCCLFAFDALCFRIIDAKILPDCRRETHKERQ